MRRTLSSESSKLRMKIEPNPEPIINKEPSFTPMFQSLTPLSQEAIRAEPVALIKSKDEPRRSTPLDRYWNKDRRRRMFRAEPTLEPTVPRPTKSVYEQKVVMTRPTMPTDAIMASPSLLIKPKLSPMPPIKIQRKSQVPRRPPSPPRPPTPPSLPSRGPSP